MSTHRENARKWTVAYKSNERNPYLGVALRLADDVFGAVGLAAEPTPGLGSQREILAAAIHEIRAAAQAELRAEILAEARAIVAGAVRIAHKELDRVAEDITAGRHFSA